MPITMMFASDQVGAKYLQYVTDYRVLAEAQLRTAERFGLDFVSCISDPARECADLGAKIRFFDDQPPAFVESDALLADKSVLGKLKIPDPLGGGRMHDRVKAAALLKERAGAELIVEGWIEGPCTMAANLRGINTLMLDFYDDPAFVDDLLAFAAEVAITFARAQREAGIDLMGVGDAPASLIGRNLFENVVGPWHAKIVAAMREMGLKTRSHICGNTSKICEARSPAGLRHSGHRFAGGARAGPAKDGAGHHHPGQCAHRRGNGEGYARGRSADRGRMPSRAGRAVHSWGRMRGAAHYAHREHGRAVPVRAFAGLNPARVGSERG